MRPVPSSGGRAIYRSERCLRSALREGSRDQNHTQNHALSHWLEQEAAFGLIGILASISCKISDDMPFQHDM